MKVGDMILAVNTDSFMKLTYDEVEFKNILILN